MKRLLKNKRFQLLLLLGISIMPLGVQAEITGGSAGLSQMLDRAYDQMIPMAGRLIGVGQGLAGFAALWYIAVRVWKHLARAEPIDFYPLLRPFAIGLAIVLFLPMVRLMNGVLQPIETATRALAGDSQQALFMHIEAEEKAAKAPPPEGLFPSAGSQGAPGYEVPAPGSDGEGFSASLQRSFFFLHIKNTFKTVMCSMAGLLYEAAVLCVHAVRTFYLIVLVLLGPIALGLSVFDGFQHTLSGWLAQYVNIYMWLPVAHIFGGIMAKVLQNIMTGDPDFYSSTAYIIFMLMSVVGYTMVPKIAGSIVRLGRH